MIYRAADLFDFGLGIRAIARARNMRQWQIIRLALSQSSTGTGQAHIQCKLAIDEWNGSDLLEAYLYK